MGNTFAGKMLVTKVLKVTLLDMVKDISFFNLRSFGDSFMCLFAICRAS